LLKINSEKLGGKTIVKKGIMVTAASLLLLVLAGCVSIDRAQANYCQALGDYGRAVANLRHIDANSTTEELQDALQEVSRAWDDLAKSAGRLADAQYRELEQAQKDLERMIEDIPDDATLVEAQVSVRLATLETLARYVDIASTTCIYPDGRQIER
jgi:tetratricopeptide (TPR) repeat protein